MKITIKSLKQVPYEVELASDELLIKDLKAEIEIAHGFDANSIKILFKGSMLDDNKHIKDYKIAEGDILTMMSSKVKPQNINTNPEPKITEESKENNNKNNNNKETKKTENLAAKPNSQTNTQTLVSSLLNSLNTNNNPTNTSNAEAATKSEPQKDYSAEALQLTEMGFGFAEALRAVQAAKGSLERAVDFLYNGIPENFGAQGALQQNYLGAPRLEDFLDPEDEEGEEAEDEDQDNNGEIPLTFEIDPHMLDSLDLKDPNSLKTIASFVKVLISEDPSSLQNLLEDIEETNPEIIEFIKEHEEEFKQLISAPLEDKDLEKFLPIAAANNQNLNLNSIANLNNENENENFNNEKSNQKNKQENQNQEADKDEDSEMVGGEAQALNIEGIKKAFTEAEKESIERLKVLGFSEEEVSQAFVACEKNEMLTANFLLENKFRDPNSMDVDGN